MQLTSEIPCQLPAICCLQPRISHGDLGAAFLTTQDADLAKKVSNPIASLVSVPFQFNYDSGYGPSDGHKAVLNIQPVIPFELNDDWNVISRTIVPVTSQDDIAGGQRKPVWTSKYAPELFLLAQGIRGRRADLGRWSRHPYSNCDGASAWRGEAGARSHRCFLKQEGPWTYGTLANHIWSVAGDGGRADISSTFLQPFASYTTHDAWTFTLDTESTYDWKSDQWSVPINFSVSKLVTFDKQPVSFQVGARYWAESPEGGPQGWGVRVAVTFLFPT